MRRVFLIISLLCLMPFAMMAQTAVGESEALSEDYAYGFVINSDNGVNVSGSFVNFKLDAPASTLNELKQYDGLWITAAEMVPYNSTKDFVYAYATTNGTDGKFCKVDPVTGDLTVIKDGVEPMTEMAYDPTTKTMYGLSLGVLYTINLDNGTTTEINEMQTGSNNWVALAINNDGVMYAITSTSSEANAELYRIMHGNGYWNSTLVGTVPYRTQYAQSMAFDRDNGTLYWWQTSVAGSNLLQVDPETATCTVLWPNNAKQVTGLMFQNRPEMFDITYETIQHGSVSGPAQAAENDVITVNTTFEPGFGMGTIIWTANGEEHTITGEAPFQFTMPDAPVTVSAEFVQTGVNTVFIGTDYYGYFDDIVTVAVEMTNENLVAGVQMDINLGPNLTFQEGSLALSERAEGEGWNIFGSLYGNILRVTIFQNGLAYFTGNEGAIFTFQVKCARVVSNNTLPISGLVCGTPDAFNLAMLSVNGALEIKDVTMNQPTSLVVCNNALAEPAEFGTEIEASEGEVTYAWTNDTPAIGLAAEGNGNIAAFTAVNEGNAPVVATIAVTPTLNHNGNDCVGSTLNFTITVNPTGVVNAVENIEVHNGDLIPEIEFTSPNEGGEMTYAWTNDNPEIGLAAEGTGNIAAFTAINEQVSVVSTANITVVPTFTNAEVSCEGEAITFTITVNPTKHYITVLDPNDGELATEPAEVGVWQEPVTVLPTPDPGFSMGTITWTANGEENTITEEPYEFIMPDYDVTVSAEYVQTGVNTVFIGTNYYGYFDDIVTVAVEMTNENLVAGLQMNIDLGENLTYQEGSIALADRTEGEDWVITGTMNGHVLLVTIFQTGLAPFAGNEGALFTFQVKCARVVSNNTLAISNLICGTPDGTNLNMLSTDGALEIKDVVMNQPEDILVCNNTLAGPVEFSSEIEASEGEMTYAWTNDNTEIGLAAEGNGNIDAFTATNTTGAPILATITVTPTLIHNGNTCVGSSKTFTATVNPTPVVEAIANQIVCNGAETEAVAFLSNITDENVSYAWTNDNTEIGLAAEGTGNIDAFTATNTTGAPILATITVTPTYTNGISCEGEAVTFTITVNPTPVMEAVDNQIVCNGAETEAVAFLSNITDENVSYAWTNDNTEIGLAAEGTGNIDAFTATNTTGAPILATITVTPTYTNEVSCIGEAITFTITVNPTPVVEPVDNQIVCNGAETEAVTFLSNITDENVSYTWTNDNIEIGLAPEGNGNIDAFTATNTTDAAITATITVTPTYTNEVSCIGEAITFTITVNPTPVMEVVANQMVCNGAEVAAINFATNVTDGEVTYAWVNDNPAIGLAAEGTGNIAAFMGTNSETAAIVANITVTPTYTNGVSCVGEPMTFTVTVLPQPVMDEVTNKVTCDDSELAIEFTTPITDGTVTYAWTNDTPAIGLDAEGTGNITFVATNTTADPIVANIEVIPTYTMGEVSCIGEAVTFTITVYPATTVDPVENQTVYSRESTEAIFFSAPVNDYEQKVIFNWVNDNPAIGLAAEGTGHIPSFITAPCSTEQVAHITVTPIYNGEEHACEGNSTTFTITVLPTFLVVINDGITNGTLVDNARVAANGDHYAPAGEEITLTATPAEDYFLDFVTVTALENGNIVVPFTAEYKFDMPEFDVLCNANFIDANNLSIQPGILDLGYRPINAWMYSKFFDVNNISESPFDVTEIDFTSYEFMALDPIELPFTIEAGESAQIGINTNYKNVTPGLYDAMMALKGVQNRKAYLRKMVATAYTPVEPDVWELATNVTTFPFVSTQETAGTLYNVYQMPGETPDGYDGVYKIVVDRDVILDAAVTAGNDPKIAVYDAGFKGVGGPHTNNYHGAAEELFNEAIIGTGTTTNGSMPYSTYYNYSISQMLFTAAELQAAGLQAGKVNAIEFASNSTNGFTRSHLSVWMAPTTLTVLASPSNSVAGMNKVFEGSMTQVPGWNKFQFNGAQDFVWDGTSNILVTVLNSEGAWNSPQTYWLCTNAGFTAAMYAQNDGSAYTPETSTYTMTTSSNRPNIHFIGESTMTEGVAMGDEPIVALGLYPGTYYVVASSTSEDSYTVEINIQDMPLPEAPVAIYPANEAQGIPTPVTLEYELGQYTHEYQILLGTSYNNQEVVLDWTSNLSNTFDAGELLHNKIYYWRINERNTTGVTEGPLWAFTTVLNEPLNLAVADDEIYEGETAEFSWDTPLDRTFRGYNLYQDGVKVNETMITGNTYSLAGLTYNMDGYNFNLTAIYDEGESEFSNTVNVKVSGYGIVSGHVYEQDGTTGIAGATVTIAGFDEFDELQAFEFTTNAEGAYSGNVLAGYFFGMAEKEGYQTAGDNMGIEVVYQETITDYDFILNENYTAVARVVAEEINDNQVHVYWGWDMIEDFESGTLTAYDWVNDATYPFVLTTNNPYEGNYCIKSSNEGVNYSSSIIQITMMTAQDGLMSFAAKISSESGWDKGYFYIDGATKMTLSGEGNWIVKEYPITAGMHTFKWEYYKDVSNSYYDDCLYLDYINFWYAAPPTPEGQIFVDFETGMPNNWTTIDADGDGHNWLLGSTAYSVSGHDESTDFAASQSYASGVGALSPDNYLVSPQIELGGSITFWANNYSVYYPEQLGVAVSTTGNTSSADFTTIWTQTIESKKGEVPASMPRDGAKPGEWIQYTVDLSAYAGQTGYVALRHYGTYNQWAVMIDDISIEQPRERAFTDFNVYRRNNSTGGTAQQLVSGITEFEYDDNTWGSAAAGVYQWGVSANYAGNRGESEITWSNKIDKNMTTNVTVHVSTNSNDPVTGAKVTLTNTSESALGIVYNATLDETGTYAWDNFRKGTYDVAINLDGFLPLTATATVWEPTTLSYVLTEIINNVEDLYVSTTGWAMFGDMPTGGGASEPWNADFEDGLPEGWTVLDENNDGWTWTLTSDIPSTWTYYASIDLPWYQSGTNAICSGSYINGVGAITPDEYLVTPQVTPGAGSTFSFWAAAADASYPAEHFGVFVSTTGTAASDFVSVQEWTLTAKESGNNGGRASRDGNGAKLGTFHNYSVDLSAYAGQNIYIAIRHFNCNDQYIMVVDDIEYGADRKVEYYNVKLDGVMEGTTTLPFFQHDVTDLIEGESYITSVQRVYTTGESEWTDFEWVYTACDNYAGLPSDPTAHWSGEDVVLNWTLPSGGDGPTPPPTGETSFSFDFEGDLNGWTVLKVNAAGGEWIHSSGNLGGYDYSELAHGGTGFAMCYSFVDYVGAYNTDAYLISPQKYGIVNGSTLTFWADNANDSYPENFSVCIATADNPTANDFTQVWSGGAKGKGGDKAAVRHNGTRYENWRQHTIDLSAYAGQNVYIAFHDVNEDMYEIWIDDVTISASGTPVDPVDPDPTPGADVLGVQIFRDGEWIAQVKAPATTYIDLAPESAGEYTFRVYYDGDTEDYMYYRMSCPQSCGVDEDPCKAPQNLIGSYVWNTPNEFGALINWTYGEYGTWLFYGNGGVNSMVGVGGGPFYWGDKFPASTIAPYADAALTQVAFIAYGGNDQQAGIYTINIYIGGEDAPATLVHTQDYDFDGVFSGDWTYVDLTTPVALDPTQTLWITLFNEGISYPAVFSNSGPTDPNGRLISEDGIVWEDVAQYIASVKSWSLRGYITNAVEGGETVALAPQHSNSSNSRNFAVAEFMDVQPEFDFHHGNRTANSFNVYRNGALIANVDANDTGIYEYFDQVAIGNYEYKVTALYDECESSAALTPDGSMDYVEVAVTDVNELSSTTKLYPNPTTGNVKIEASGMTHITVVNTLGQVLYDANVRGDMYELSLSQYNAGLYLVRIAAENGVTVKRVTLVK